MVRTQRLCRGWESAYWSVTLIHWRQYDAFSTTMCVLLGTIIVLRSTLTRSSYAPGTIAALRATQLTYFVTMAVQLLVGWLIVRAPAVHVRWRHTLACLRWLSAALMVVSSNPLPVFQAGGYSRSSSQQWWIARCLGFAFRAGITFPISGPAFWRMPWPRMAAMGLTYATLLTLLNVDGYCSRVVALHGSPQPHADAAVIWSTASMFDLFLGQGSMQQQAGGVQEAGTSAGHSWQQEHAGVWQSTADRIHAACTPSTPGVGDTGSTCAAALHGQCVAIVVTLLFGVTYLTTMVVHALERLSQWHFLQQHQRQQDQQMLLDQQRQQRQREQHANAAPSSSANGVNGSSSSNGGGNTPSLLQRTGATTAAPSSTTVRTRSVVSDPQLPTYLAPTVSALLRMEVLKVVVLGDIPILLVWWALSTYLRPAGLLGELLAVEGPQ